MTHEEIVEEIVEEMFDTEYIGGKQPNLTKEWLTKTLTTLLTTTAQRVREETIEEVSKQQKWCREHNLFSHRAQKCVCYQLQNRF